MRACAWAQALGTRAKSRGEKGPGRGLQRGADRPAPWQPLLLAGNPQLIAGVGVGVPALSAADVQRNRNCCLPQPPAPHQQQLVALAEAGLLGQGARLDRVDEAPARVAPEQRELGDEAVAAQRAVLHRGPGAPHVPHGRDRRPEGSASGDKTGVRQLWLGLPAGTPRAGPGLQRPRGVAAAATLGESWRPAPAVTSTHQKQGPRETLPPGDGGRTRPGCLQRVQGLLAPPRTPGRLRGHSPPGFGESRAGPGAGPTRESRSLPLPGCVAPGRPLPTWAWLGVRGSDFGFWDTMIPRL